MPEIRMRPKHQVTLPASVVRQANIAVDDRLTVTYLNGSIIITPKQARQDSEDLMAFAGIGRGLWGDSAEAVDARLRNQRDEWDR